MDEMMVFARHTCKWEFAHKEPFDFGGKAEQWVRRDGSSICAVGDEVAVQPVPPPPFPVVTMQSALQEASQLIATHCFDPEVDGEMPSCTPIIEDLARITDAEWDFVRGLLKVEHECNENPLAMSTLRKLLGGEE